MYFLGVDFGGGSCKATLLNAAGNVEAEFPPNILPNTHRTGGAEQQPEMWLRAALDCITNLTRRVRPEEIKCLCFSAATHTAVLTDGWRPSAGVRPFIGRTREALPTRRSSIGYTERRF